MQWLGLKLKKMHYVFEFIYAQWLKKDFEFITFKRTEAEKNPEKYKKAL